MNKKVKVEFSYGGKDYKFFAYLGKFSTGVTYLLNIEENENVSHDEYYDDKYHSLSFWADGYVFEVEFEYGEDGDVCFDKPRKCIVWDEDPDKPIIDGFSADDIEVTVTNTYKKSNTR